MLCNLNDVLRPARAGHYGVGLFNTITPEMTEAVFSAAEKLNAPVIMGTAEILLPAASLQTVADMVLERAGNSSVPVVLHYDHGLTFEKCLEAMKKGFTSVMYDCSTASYEDNIRDVAEMVKGPFVASHSDARAVEGHSRNLTDDMIKELARHGGVTGINFFSKFLGHDGTGSMEQILAHFKHIKQVGGIDVLALGSDFDGFGGHSGVRTCEDFPKLIDALNKAGFTAEEIDKITYKNALRVVKDVIG